MEAKLLQELLDELYAKLIRGESVNEVRQEITYLVRGQK